MSKHHTSRSERQGWERLEAEDRVLDYLSHHFATREQQAAVAIRVEMHLAAKWEIEQREFWQHMGDDRFLCIREPEDKDRRFKLMRPDRLNEIKRLFSETAPGTSDSAAEQSILDSLAKFHTDRAWWIAGAVRKYLVVERDRERRIGKSQALPPDASLKPTAPVPVVGTSGT